MDALAETLSAARDRDTPAVPDDLPAFYRNWANLVAGYEQFRFYDDTAAAREYCDRIRQSQWQRWLRERL